ncbi:hypothetical protein ACTFIW_000225 [Dictyostelium discoideum]
MLERFQEEHDGFDFSGAEFTGNNVTRSKKINNILKFITSNIPKQVILNKNNKFLNKSLYLNNYYYNRNIENAKIINQTATTTTIIGYPHRRYDNDDDNDNNNNNGRLNFLPSKDNKDSLLEERISGVLKTVDTLRSNEKVQAVFGQDFTAKGLGFRSNGSFNYKHSIDKNGDKIVFKIKILKVKYENYKTITIVDEALPKKFNNKLKNFLSIFGITINNNDNSGGGGSSN